MTTPELLARVQHAVDLVDRQEKTVRQAMDETFGSEQTKNADDLLGRAIALKALGRTKQAFAPARLAAKLAPRILDVQVLVARIAWETENAGVAQKAFQQALALSNRDPKLLAEFARFMAEQRGPKLGEAAALEAIKADVNNAEAWAALAQSQHRLRRFGDAQATVQRALELDGECVPALELLGEWLVAAKEFDGAEVAAAKLAALPGGEEAAARIAIAANQGRAQKMLYERKEVQDAVGSKLSQVAEEERRQNALAAARLARAFLGIPF